MPGKPRLSYECREELETWLRAHCPCSFDDPDREFYRGLLFICQEEVDRAIARERQRITQRLQRPSPQ
jgi:hypothetical protein